MKRSTTSRHTCKTLPHNLHHSKFQLHQGLKTEGWTSEVLGGNIKGRVSLEQWYKKHRCGSRSARAWEKMRLKRRQTRSSKGTSGRNTAKRCLWPAWGTNEGPHTDGCEKSGLKQERSLGWPFQSRRDEVQTLGGEQTPEGLGMEEWGRRWPREVERGRHNQGNRWGAYGCQVKGGEARRQAEVHVTSRIRGRSFHRTSEATAEFANEGWQLSPDALDSGSHWGLDQFFDPGQTT